MFATTEGVGKLTATTAQKKNRKSKVALTQKITMHPSVLKTEDSMEIAAPGKGLQNARMSLISNGSSNALLEVKHGVMLVDLLPTIKPNA